MTDPIINNNNNDNDADCFPQQDKQPILPHQDISPKPTHSLMKMLIMMKMMLLTSTSNNDAHPLILCGNNRAVFKLFIFKMRCEVTSKEFNTNNNEVQ